MTKVLKNEYNVFCVGQKAVEIVIPNENNAFIGMQS